MHQKTTCNVQVGYVQYLHMRGNLFPTTVYLDDNLRKQIDVLSITSGKPKAAIMRKLMSEGIKVLQVQHTSSAQSLLSLVGIIPKGSGLPKDLSTNHDKYAWEE
jgi:hypothetical protein